MGNRQANHRQQQNNEILRQIVNKTAQSNIRTQPLQSISCQVSIDPNTLKIYQIKNELFSLTFNFWSKESDWRITLFFDWDEILDDKNLTEGFQSYFGYSNQHRFPSGKNQEFPMNTINLSKNHIEQLENKLWVIEIIPNIHNIRSHSAILYFTFRNGKPITIKRKIQLDSQAFELAEVYGNGNGNDCTIWLTEPRQILILPWKHFWICKACSEKLNQRCPICRARIERLVPFTVDLISNAC